VAALSNKANIASARSSNYASRTVWVWAPTDCNSHQNACATRTADTVSHQGSAGISSDISGVCMPPTCFTWTLAFAACAQTMKQHTYDSSIKYSIAAIQAFNTGSSSPCLTTIPGCNECTAHGQLSPHTENQILSQPCTYAAEHGDNKPENEDQ
jgi:hypothetical protein